MKIPHLKKTAYVFPGASARIGQAHRDRFPILKDIFQRNVESCTKLCDCITFISYELRMCGPSLETAIPSLLVFCPLKSLKTLKSILTKPHIKAQYAQDESDSHLVQFGIFFWGRAMELLGGFNAFMILRAEQDEASASNHAAGGLLPWGLHVATTDNPHRYSTMGCFIRARSEHFGLTVAHIFEDSEAAADRGVEPEDPDSEDEDEEYDLRACQEDTYDDDITVTPRDLGASSLYHGEDDIEPVGCEVHLPPRDGAWANEHPYLDWAMLKMNRQDARLFACLQCDHSQPATLSVAQCLPPENIGVLIITARHVEVPGELYPIPSYIGGAMGSGMSEAWTVNILDPKCCKFFIAFSATR